MINYYIALGLLLCFALQNRNIYARLHPSAEIEISTVPLLHASHQSSHHQPHQQLQYLQQQHTRQLRNHHLRHIKLDSSIEKKTLQQKKDDQRLRRHLHRQQVQLEEQEGSYQQAKSDQLMSSPKLWQLLSESKQFDELFVSQQILQNTPEAEEQTYDLMMNDDAGQIDVKNDLQQSLAEVVPPFSIEEVIEESNATKATSSGCPKCESSRQVEHISEDELRHLRIEFVKKQILEKLRLKESPKVSGVELPRPIFEGITLQHEEKFSKHKDFDDYYARTNQKFILLQREITECQRLGALPSMCFSFKIEDADADGFDVSSAVLWLFKNNQNYTKGSNKNQLSIEQNKQTIVVSELEQRIPFEYLPLAKTIAIQSVDVQDEWMKINIEWPIKRWFGNHDLSHLIQITCESCNIGSMEEIISLNKNYRPFIMIDTQNRHSKSRHKRNINCSSGVTECCREKLYISFADIGWDNWIMQPKGYDAYFCRGSCTSVASVAQAASHHSSLLKMLSTNGKRKPLELIPCCTAKQYSSLQLVVLDSNNSATIKTLPNMVVESCGCR